MQSIQEQLDSFNRFVCRNLQHGTDLSLAELVQLWRLENPSDCEWAAVVAAIKMGERDIEAGNYRPAEEFIDEMRKKHGIPSRG